jgi:hypothetical protein
VRRLGLLECIIAGVSPDLFDLEQGREQLADLLCHLGRTIDVPLEAGPLAAAIPSGELPGQPVEPAVVAGPG